MTLTITAIDWKERDLIEFIRIILPEELQSDLARAGPLLFGCVQRLGSFPWHNQPLQANTLDFDTLVTAIVILTRRYESLSQFHTLCCWPRDDHRRPDMETQRDQWEMQKDQWLRRLLFQCMAVSSANGKKAEAEEQVPQDDVSHGGVDRSGIFARDNAHLLQAHRLVSMHHRPRKEDGEGEAFIPGPPGIEVTALPSSRSQDFDGAIPTDEFQSLAKILLASQLYLYGY